MTKKPSFVTKQLLDKYFLALDFVDYYSIKKLTDEELVVDLFLKEQVPEEFLTVVTDSCRVLEIILKKKVICTFINK